MEKNWSPIARGAAAAHHRFRYWKSTEMTWLGVIVIRTISAVLIVHVRSALDVAAHHVALARASGRRERVRLEYVLSLAFLFIAIISLLPVAK